MLLPYGKRLCDVARWNILSPECLQWGLVSYVLVKWKAGFVNSAISEMERESLMADKQLNETFQRETMERDRGIWRGDRIGDGGGVKTMPPPSPKYACTKISLNIRPAVMAKA